MERLKRIKDCLIQCVEGEIYGDLSSVDTKELGEAIDMIKDMEEAMYYCSIVKAMEEAEEEEKYERKYYPRGGRRMYPYYFKDERDMDRDIGKMYFHDDGFKSSYVPERTEMYDSYPMEIRDVREGRSPMRRKTYMESKELHHDKAVQIKELEGYLKELSEDVTEMIKDATPEEKALLQQKLTTLASKIK